MHSRLAHWIAPRQPTLWLLTTLFFFPTSAWSNTPECAWQPTMSTNALAGVPLPSGLRFEGSPPPGLEAPEVEDALRQAARTWNDARCSPELKIITSQESGPASPVLFVEEDPCLPQGFLAFTVYACRDYPYGTVLLNARDFRWKTSPSPLQPLDEDGRLIVDLLSVLTHELGHVLGLGHVEDGLATMTPRYLGDGGQSTLAAIDKLMLCATHNETIRECTSNPECPFLTCVADGTNSVCEEERGEIGDFCGADLLICQDCFISSPGTLSGYCTLPCGECPPDMVCGEGDLCEFMEQPRISGCSSASGSAGWGLFCLALIFWRSRSKRESARILWSSSLVSAHRKSQ